MVAFDVQDLNNNKGEQMKSVGRQDYKNLSDRDCYVQVFPAKTSFEEMKAWNPDGFMLSNGPGDPAPAQYAVNTAKK